MGDQRERCQDGGFTLAEVMVALGIMSIVMTSLAVFMINSRRSAHYSALRDTAVQLVVEGMEKGRAVRGSALLGGRAQCTACATMVSSDASALLGTGVARWDAAGAGTLTVPAPGTQADGSVVSSPANPEVVQLDGVLYKRYYYVGACYQAAATVLSTTVSCGASSSSPALLARLVVAVSWPGAECPGGTCTYADAALFSIAVTDPFLTG